MVREVCHHRGSQRKQPSPKLRRALKDGTQAGIHGVAVLLLQTCHCYCQFQYPHAAISLDRLLCCTKVERANLTTPHERSRSEEVLRG